MFYSSQRESFSLENFEGPLEFLLHLIQRREIDVYDISIQKITQQYLQRLGILAKRDLDDGAEFVGKASLLLLLKSCKLLPDLQQKSSFEEEENLDPNFEVIHHLLDYCQFKNAAKTLTAREEKRMSIYTRGLGEISHPRPSLGIEHLSIEDLQVLFQKVVEKSESKQQIIDEEDFRVADKIRMIKDTLKHRHPIAITALLSLTMGRGELIATFLALLELIKTGNLKITKDLKTNEIIVYRTKFKNQNFGPGILSLAKRGEQSKLLRVCEIERKAKQKKIETKTDF